MKIRNLSKICLVITFSIIFLNGCSYLKKKETNSNNEKERENVSKTRKNYEFNTDKKISQASGGLFSRKEQDVFGKNNVMWQAALETLSILPISSANYEGGVITTDWYGNEKDQIKISILFKSSEIRPSSFEVNSFKKSCNTSGRCGIKKGDNNFNNKIKSQIVEKIKDIEISKEK